MVVFISLIKNKKEVVDDIILYNRAVTLTPTEFQISYFYVNSSQSSAHFRTNLQMKLFSSCKYSLSYYEYIVLITLRQ